MAVRHHRPDAGRRIAAPATSPATSSTPPSTTCIAPCIDLGERIASVRAATAAAAPPEEAVKDLAKGVDQLVRQMRAEQKVVREWVDEQAAQQSEVASVLKELAATVPRK